MAIAENIEKIRGQIAHACEKVDRGPDAIQLVAVTKTVGVPAILEALDAGIEIIGENRVQEAWDKYEAIGDRARWHMIGHLQRNKVKRVLEFAEMIQSVDSLRLAKEVQKQAQKLDRSVDVLLEVNTSGEETKYGFSPDNTVAAIEQIAELPNLNIKGLMTIGAFLPDPEDVRPCFRRLHALRDEVRQRAIAGVDMEVLSMGMTDDFEVAVEEGATMVRIGRSIFGERPD